MLNEIRDAIKQYKLHVLDVEIQEIKEFIFESMDDAYSINVDVCLYDLNTYTFYYGDHKELVDHMDETQLSPSTIGQASINIMKDLYLKYYGDKNTYNVFRLHELKDGYYVGLWVTVYGYNYFLQNIIYNYTRKIDYRLSADILNTMKYIRAKTRVTVFHGDLQHIINDGLHEVQYDRPFQLPLSLLEVMATERYEKSENRGAIVFVKNASNLCTLKFGRKVPFNTNNRREIRKLLELSDKNNSLFLQYNECSDGNYNIETAKNPPIVVSGIGPLTQDHPSAVYAIKYHKFMHFTVMRNGVTELEYINGSYRIPRQGRSLSKTDKIKLVAAFPDTSNILEQIVLQAFNQDHGTVLIITNNAKEASSTLCDMNRGYVVTDSNGNPINLCDSDMISNITSIDGAVMLDGNGYCYAIGVILDGHAKEKGDPSRGARYNSSANYIKVKKLEEPNNKYVAVIISDDKTIDIKTYDDFK